MRMAATWMARMMKEDGRGWKRMEEMRKEQKQSEEVILVFLLFVAKVDGGDGNGGDGVVGEGDGGNGNVDIKIVRADQLHMVIMTQLLVLFILLRFID